MVDFVTKRFVTEDNRFLLRHYNRHDDTDFILFHCLYKIEYLWLIKHIKTKNFKIYDIEFLKDKRKRLFIRINGKNEIKIIVIPPLLEHYKNNDVYVYKKVYIWRKPNGDIIKRYSLNNIYNRYLGRNYRVGDINKYGHELIRITNERLYSHSYKSLEYVGLCIW